VRRQSVGPTVNNWPFNVAISTGDVLVCVGLQTMLYDDDEASSWPKRLL